METFTNGRKCSKINTKNSQIHFKSPSQAAESGGGFWGGRWRSGGLQEQPWNGEWSRLTGGGSLGCRVALRGRGRGLALALLEDVQTFSQAAEGGSRRGFEEQEVLVQTGQRTSGGEGVDGVDQGLLLALCLGHDLGRRKRQS